MSDIKYPPCRRHVRKKNGNGGERLGIIKDAADGTHEAHAAFVLRGVRVTPRERRAVLLQFANPVKRRLRARTTIRSRRVGMLRRGRRRRVSPRGPRRRRAGGIVRRQLASHVRGRREVRHGRAGENVG